MKIAILGNLAGVANEMIIELRKAGVEADLFVKHKQGMIMLDDLKDSNNSKFERMYYLDLEQPASNLFLQRIIYMVRMFFYQFFLVFRILIKYDLIHSHTGSINFSPLSYLLFVKLQFKKYLAFATGSDIREVAQLDNTWRGMLMRNFFENASQVLLLNVDMLSFRDKMGLYSARFFPFMINEEKYAPRENVKKSNEHKDKLFCFMMSILDFGHTDNKPHRRAIKHNERFFYALSEFVKIDTKIHAIVLDRGPDKEVAKELVYYLGLLDYVTFQPPMNEAQRIKHISMADVIIDQFDPGSFGLGAIEALSMGKPLITYFQEDLIPESYGDSPPILNAKTIEDIFKRLIEIRDPYLRKDISVKARQWALKHHSRGVVMPKLVQLYETTMNRQ